MKKIIILSIILIAILGCITNLSEYCLELKDDKSFMVSSLYIAAQVITNSSGSVIL